MSDKETAPPCRPYMGRLLKKLADPSEAFHYINAAWQESPEVFIQAVKDVAQAVAVESRAPAPQPTDLLQTIRYLLLSWSVFYAKLPDGEYDGLGEMRTALANIKDVEVILAATPQVTPLITFSKGASAGVNMQALAHSCYLTNPEGTSEPASEEELELEKESDGRWIAEFNRFPGVMAYGATEEEAIRNAAKVLIESDVTQECKHVFSKQSGCCVRCDAPEFPEE